MISRWQWLVLLFARRLWVRVTLFSLAAVLTAIAGIVFAPYVPAEWSTRVGAQAIDDILTILGSSMLAVTVFSVGTMVSIYSATSATVTPRATRLLIEDNTSKNVLGTFIGAFLYSLVGIVALNTGAYGEAGRAILLVVTIGLIVLIAATLLQWIDFLSRFGRVGAIITRVERATAEAMQRRLDEPYFGGCPLVDPGRQIPGDAQPIHADAIGYIANIDVAALSEYAEANGAEIFLTALPGTFAEPSRPVAMVRGLDAAAVRHMVLEAYSIDDERTFDQDPRYGLCVLAEIGSRALSPGVNDPGTAIDVIGRAVRLLAHWVTAQQREPVRVPRWPRVWVPAIRIDDMFDDIFRPLARDGASLIEVQVRLQKAFRALAHMDDPEVRRVARRHAASALAQAEARLATEEERAIVRRLVV